MKINLNRDGLYFIDETHALYRYHELDGAVLSIMRKLPNNEWIAATVKAEDLGIVSRPIRELYKNREGRKYCMYRFCNGTPFGRPMEYPEVQQYLNLLAETFTLTAA